MFDRLSCRQRNRKESSVVVTRGNNSDLFLRRVVLTGLENVALRWRGGDQHVALVIDHFLFTNSRAKVVLFFEFLRFAIHVVPLPSTD